MNKSEEKPHDPAQQLGGTIRRNIVCVCVFEDVFDEKKPIP